MEEKKEGSATARRVSYDQVKTIMDFMGQHVEFAMGVLRTTEARHKSKKLWEELTQIVNSVPGGTEKTPDMWSRYWSDFKNKLKKKVKFLERKKRMDDFSEKETKALTKMEKRALVILGPKFVKVSCRNSDSYNKLLEVKVEESQENGDIFREQSDCSDRLSLDEESEESASEENGEETVPNFTETCMSNIYPKWLIAVEKQRAEAELSRARAEEQRVSLAAKSAEAAVQQAEALKKLAEAATVQADALLRIAMCLESKGHNIPHLLPL